MQILENTKFDADGNTVAAWRAVCAAAKRLEHRPTEANLVLEDLALFDAALRRLDALPPLPRVVCLCGSTRQRGDFEIFTRSETAAGRIVLSVGSFTWEHSAMSKEELYGEEQARRMDELHKRKIDLADEVLVIQSLSGYCGLSTMSEIRYALRTGKMVRLAFPERGVNGLTCEQFAAQLYQEFE